MLLAQIPLTTDESVVTARRQAREAAALLGFDAQDQTRIATAVSELARNAHRYARRGRVRLEVPEPARDRLRVEVVDEGPGIADVPLVLSGRYVSATGMGRGLSGVRRLMDDFDIDSGPTGTTVAIAKRGAGVGDGDLAAVRDRLGSRRSDTALDEVEQQNRELLRALGELRARQDELVALNRELEDTNRGVVALYAELDETAARLREADTAKTRFLSSFSHELRTPLNSIQALAGLLLEPGADPLTAEQSRQVTYVQRLAGDQIELVGDLLDIAKIEAGRLDVTVRSFSITEVFALLRAYLRPLVDEEAVTLTFTTRGDIPELDTDEDKLAQILRNFIANALKFTERGTVTVTAEADAGWLSVRVADTGIGIPEDALGRIFEEFTQGDRAPVRGGRGTGLGLALAQRLAGLLGGAVGAESVVGEGSTFWLRVPLRHAGLSPGDGPILIVDDDEPARYVIASLLKPLGWSTLEAAGGAAALTTIRDTPPAAVVLDLQMPGLDGRSVLKRLRSEPVTARLPVVIHTAAALASTDRAHLDALGAVVLDKARTSRDSLLRALSAASDKVRR
ncbi:ATP-binding protein [Paraconexibacter antarcticus]|uniref:histidine kinase n=1 Tax=Paraconexibacter antarcticus TaxID=2949664 RepID=A0ABY5E1X4_9ACTN|nr:ATP-binding protein [Paraconexibacter antarcticus]UTI66837.1 ATP-binding protein [Paraconexibacter antarcticus]